MMKVRNFPGMVSWPPMPGGAYTSYQAFPTDENVLVTEVFPVMNEFVTFTCEFQGPRHSYDLQMVDVETAREFARLLSRHVGTTLEKFGDFRLDY